MNYTKIFYWLTVADNARVFFIVCASVMTIIGIVSMLIKLNAFDNSPDERKGASKWVFWSWPMMFFFWGIWILTPNKKDALLIVAGGGTLNYLTTDSTAKQIPHELTNFVVTEIKNMAAEAKVNLNLQNQKEKILDEVKNMTGSEVIEKMKVDSNFAKIVQGK